MLNNDTADDPSDDFWTQQAKLTTIDASADDALGHSVAISGDTVIVGAYLDDDAGTSSGAAYVFQRNGTTWIEAAKLTANSAAAGDFFGFSVDVDADTAIDQSERDVTFTCSQSVWHTSQPHVSTSRTRLVGS